jgi:hypothetical protein
MGRYIQTVLGQRWTDEPSPDEASTRLTYPSRTLQTRMRAVEDSLDKLVSVMDREAGSNAPSLPTLPLTEEDIQDLAERLAEDRSWLPHRSHVETRAEDNSSPLSRAYGPTYVDRATSISIPIIGTFTPRQLLEQGLVKGGTFQAHVYERMLSEVDGVVKGKVIGPRDVMFARQEAARAKYPRLWHN